MLHNFLVKLLLKISIAFLFIGIIYIEQVNAQQANYYFTTFRTDNGLSHNKVNAILKDKRGFLWFGTEDGLTRYDGKYYTIYKSEPNTKNVISGNIIRDLYEDKEGVIWIATSDGGLTKYNYRLAETKQFKQYKHDAHNPGSIPENGINKIAEDRYGNLWLATSGSYVVRFNKSTGRFDTPVKSGTSGILTLQMTSQDTLLVGKAGGGLMKINTKTLEFKADKRYTDLYAKLPHASISSLYEDKDHELWYGSWDNILYKSLIDGRSEMAFLPSPGVENATVDNVVSFAEDSQRQIWMAGKSTGVTVYNKKTHKFVNYRHNALVAGSIGDDQVNKIYIDRQKIVWIGTNNGVSMLDPLFSPFVQHFLPKTIESLVIYDFYKDNKQRLWIGTNDGIFIQSGEDKSYEHRKVFFQGQSLTITKFFLDQDGTFYLGTDYSLFIYNEKKNTVTLLPNTLKDPVMKKLISSRIVSIVRDTIDRHPVLLVSPYGHYLTYYDLFEKRWVSRRDSVKNIIKQFNLKDNLIRKIYKDISGHSWLATGKLGLGDWQRQHTMEVQYHSYDLSNSTTISNNDVYDIQQDKKGNYWVSTYGGGLNYYDHSTRKFSHVTESSNLTEGLQSDEKGNVWMICNGHFHKYDPSLKSYSCYDLPTLQASDGIKGYVYKDSQNNLYAGGKNYYVTFNPGAVAQINNEPMIFFTDFKIFDISFNQLLSEKVIKLNHNQNYFSIEFSAPEFTGDNIQYDYKLLGVDDNWISAGKKNFASYSNLRGGVYKFMVRASNWKGSHVDKFTSITILITPPFWLRWWFYTAIIIVVCSLIYAFYRYRISELDRRHNIRNQIAQDLHDNIGSTLSSISIYSEVAKIYQQQEKNGQLETVLTTIGDTATEMISEMGDTVWAINPKNDHFGSIVQRVNSYIKPLCAAKSIKFICEVDEKLSNLSLSMAVRKNLFLFLKEVLNNAIKHSGCETLKVSGWLEHSLFILKIEDDGIGFYPETSLAEQTESLSGNGLSNLKNRARELMGVLTIESSPGKGCLVKLAFSVKNKGIVANH
jgi:ligand-binding sensor domain-containing protein/anti-sigma regulatory factor (Ser/Thr protein kinase)